MYNTVNEKLKFPLLHESSVCIKYYMYSQECSFTINDERSYFSQFNNLTFHAILALAASMKWRHS